jgi:hypothetical protein
MVQIVKDCALGLSITVGKVNDSVSVMEGAGRLPVTLGCRKVNGKSSLMQR